MVTRTGSVRLQTNGVFACVTAPPFIHTSDLLPEGLVVSVIVCLTDKKSMTLRVLELNRQTSDVKQGQGHL